MAWASKNQYAILITNENGKDLILKLPDMTQEAFSKAFGEFLKGNNIPYEEENEEDEKEKIDLFKEIYQYILDKKEKEFNYLDKKTMEKLKSTDKGKDLILKAPTMDKKELRKAIQDYLKE